MNEATTIVAAVNPDPAGILLPEWLQILLFALSVPGLYFLMVLVGRRLKRRHGVRLGWLYHPFCLGCAICLPALLLRFDWPFIRHVGAVTSVFGAVFLISLLDRYVWELYFEQRHKIAVPKFLPEVVRLAILVVAVILVLEYDYGVNVRDTLIAPGGIAIIILGLAMQDSLGNIIAGMTLQVGQPYRHGEWLLVDNKYAEVIEINWRATRLRTPDDVLFEIPHRQMAAQTIVNLNRPVRRHAMRISVGIDYSAPPTRVKDVLLHATSNAKGVLAEPKPRVYLKNFGDSSIEYEIKFWLDDYSTYYEVCDSIRTNVWYSLHRHGIKIPFPIRTVQLERPARDKQQEVQTAARLILRQQPLFKSLNDDQLDTLLPRGQAVHFGRGEKVIQQGDPGDSMFILVSGEANVIVDRSGLQTHVAALGAGDCFGEMSLLTGERRSATVIANTDCEVVEIGKGVLAKNLKENPDLLTNLSEMLARRQMETEGVLAKSQSDTARFKQSEYQAGFLDKLRKFFEM